jgi:hypothetical protein
MKGYLLAISLLFVSVPLYSAPKCLHPANGEQKDQTDRRQAALRVARLLNTAEAAVHARTGSFGDLQQVLASDFLKKHSAENPDLNLSGKGEILPGFDVTLLPKSSGYILLVGDNRDACGFAYLTDERAVIFETVPIDLARAQEHGNVTRPGK